MKPRTRRLALAVLVLCGPLLSTSPSVAQEEPVPPPVPPPTVMVEGRGHGHGVGMAQDGALAMGRSGATTSEILGHFYRGTELGRAGGALRVEVLAGGGPATVVEFPDGGEVRDGPGGSSGAGFPVRVGPGGRVELSFDGTTYRARAVGGDSVVPAAAPASATAPRIVLLSAAPPTPPSTAPPTSTTVAPRPPPPPPPSAPPIAPEPPPDPAPAPPPPPPDPASANGLWAVPSGGSTVGVVARDRRYRGVLEATPGPGGIRLVNKIDVEDYLRGMGEVRDPSWPAAALRAQAIAARTYALRSTSGGGDLCDSERCQVYLGQAAEYPAMDRAVAETRGQVVKAGGGLALTVYSANAGGISATPEEGFGSDGRGYPYLISSPYESPDPQPWSVQMDPADLARRLGYQGELTDVRVSRAGPSGRALEVTLDGSAGPMPVEGLRFMTESGLRSNLFTMRLERYQPVEEVGPLDALLPRAFPALPSGLRRLAVPSAGEPIAVRTPLDDAPWEAVVVVVLALAAARRRRSA